MGWDREGLRESEGPDLIFPLLALRAEELHLKVKYEGKAW